jgi:hypothetical protein
MTDTTKYKNVSIPIETYNNIDKGRKVIVPGMVVSRSQFITLITNEKVKVIDKSTNINKKRKKNKYAKNTK